MAYLGRTRLFDIDILVFIAEKSRMRAKLTKSSEFWAEVHYIASA